MFIFLFLMASGAVVGYRFRCVSKIHKVTSLIQIVICFLLFILGFSIGTNRLIMGNLKYFCEQAALIAGLSMLGSSVAALLVPIATVSGTFLFSAVAGFILSRWSIFDCMAVGSGFAYYSVSSVLITQLKAPSLGMQLATELGTIALLANIFREMAALIGAPLIYRFFGRLAPISAAGIGSADILLASISKYSGKEAIPIAVMHGILINISVPFFVSLFCKM